MSPWLTLDETTLFYWTLSDSASRKRKHISQVNEWASAIPTNSSKPGSQTSKSITSSRSKSGVPSLTSGASSWLSAPSVLSDKVKIISHRSSNSVNVKAGLAPCDDGGLSDNDEMRGMEREVAINSPPKGKKRLTSEVFFPSHLFYIT